MARLRSEQLPQALKNAIAPVYLVTGDEALLVQESCDHIRHRARAQGFAERELFHTDTGFKWEHLLESANSLSLFADKKIIEVRVHNGKPGDAGSKAIVEYCKAPSDDNLLLLVLPKIDKRSQNAKWYKAIDSCGAIVTVWPINSQQLPRWVAQRLKAAGLSADSEAIDVLCAKVEGNLLAAAQEIEKLKLLASGNRIDARTMADAVTDSARFDVFALGNKALAADSRAAVHCLHGLRTEGTEASVILWALAREVRLLATVKQGIDSGKSFDLCARQQGVWESRKALVKHAVYRLTQTELRRLLYMCADIDKVIKGALRGDQWNMLLGVTLALAGTSLMVDQHG